MIRESKHYQSETGEISIPALIGFPALFGKVLPAIDLNDQTGLVAIEINNVTANHFLTVKSQTMNLL